MSGVSGLLAVVADPQGIGKLLGVARPGMWSKRLDELFSSSDTP